MLINFCDWSMAPMVSSDKLCHDAFPVENLVAKTSPFSMQQGFIAESFVRAPVSLMFKFPCNVTIYKIIVDPCVGFQKSKTLEMWTESLPVKSSWLIDDSGGARFPQPQFLQGWNRIGAITMRNPGVVCFQNEGFYPTSPYDMSIISSAGDVKHLAKLGSKWGRSLNSVSRLKVRVIQADGTGVVAMRRVEVWGQPAKYHGSSLLQRCYDHFLQTLLLPQPPPSAPSAIAETLSEPTSATGDGGKETPGDQIANIPEDFFDAITWEVMAVPMLLPSGNNVDISTLDKHANAEAAWGRLPSDPFTGLEFTHDRQPAPNNFLKARIDSFLLRYSQYQNVRNLPRTVRTLHHSSATWTPGSRRGAAEMTGGDHASERKRSRLIDDESFPSSDCPAKVSPVSKSFQDASGAFSPSPRRSRGIWQRNPIRPISAARVSSLGSSKGSNSLQTSSTSAVALWNKGSNLSSAVPTPRAKDMAASDLKSLPCCTGDQSEKYPNVSLKVQDPSSQREGSDCVGLSATASASSGMPTSAEIVAAVLKGLPSFIGSKSEEPVNSSTASERTEQAKQEATCSSCGRKDTDSLLCVYRLPCNHIVCRGCLLHREPRMSGDGVSSVGSCSQCGNRYNRKRVYRIH